MLTYDVFLALRSLRRTPWLSLLVIVAIAIGVGSATVFTAIRHALGKDPLPGQSQNLFYVRLDNWRPDVAYPGDEPDALPPQLAWRDAVNLLQSPIPTHHTPAYQATMSVYPVDPNDPRPFQNFVRLCRRDFFEMFRFPFAYGGAWDAALDKTPQNVAVISDTLNQRLFGGANSVGRIFRIADREVRIVGVLAPWLPTIRYYDLTGQATNPIDDIYLPLSVAIPWQVTSSGNADSWGPPAPPGFEGALQGELLFLQYWVELPTVEARARYRDYLVSYVQEQKKAGRYPRPINVKLTSLPDLMDELGIVPPQVKVMQVVGILFMVVCSLNLVGLLLGKFLARLPEVGVRRALGASRVRVFLQHIVECEAVALFGGAAGLVLTLVSLAVINLFARQQLGRERLFQLDLPMLAAAFGFALIAGLIAGSYPAWRVSSEPTAATLKR